MTAVGSKTSFADNQRISVADAIRGVAEYGSHRHPIAIATGYFNLGGFTSIADILEAAPSVRILIGAEPEAETVPDTLQCRHHGITACSMARSSRWYKT